MYFLQRYTISWQMQELIIQGLMSLHNACFLTKVYFSLDIN